MSFKKSWVLAGMLFACPLLAQNTLPDDLITIEQDFDQASFRSSKQSSADFAKRAFAAATFALASELESKGQYSDALDKYRLAAQSDSGYIPIYARIAIIYIKLDKFPEATAFLLEKESSFPDSAEIKSLLSLLHYRQDRLVQAAEYARQSMALNPQLVANYSILAKCFQAQNKRQEIPTLIAKSQAVISDNFAYYYRLGDLWTQTLYQSAKLLDKEISAKVLPFYEKASRLAPDHIQLTFRLGQLQFDLEQYGKAALYYEKVYQKNPRLPSLRERMWSCYLSLKQDDKAIGVLESLLEDYPERKTYYPMLAELYGRTDQWAKAAEYYQLYVKLGNPDAQDYVHLANAEMRNQQPSNALTAISEAERKFPGIPTLQLYKAIILRSLERWGESLAIFQTLEQQNDKLVDSNFYFDYAITCEKSGDEARSIELLRKCLNLNPSNHQALNYLGYTWAVKGENLDEAEQMIAKALTLDPDSPAYLDSMAWVCYQKKDYGKALEYQLKAITSMPDDPEVLEHLADIYYKLGNTEKAIDAWSKASVKAKNPEPLKAKIQSAKEQLQASVQP